MVSASEHSEPVGTLPQRVRRDFSGVGYGEAMRRAREIVPPLRERARAAEDARMATPGNEPLLPESRPFRFPHPKASSAHEPPPPAPPHLPPHPSPRPPPPA